eukprot:6197302-Pleurochrysis_carterae.AAC.3
MHARPNELIGRASAQELRWREVLIVEVSRVLRARYQGSQVQIEKRLLGGIEQSSSFGESNPAQAQSTQVHSSHRLVRPRSASSSSSKRTSCVCPVVPLKAGFPSLCRQDVAERFGVGLNILPQFLLFPAGWQTPQVRPVA